jgi:hypothetical protein
LSESTRSTVIPKEANQGNRSPQEGASGCASLIGEHLGIGQARGVINGDMDELPAGGAQSLWADLELAAAMAADSVAGTTDADPPQLLDVQMDELTRALSFIAVGWLQR